MWGGVVEPSRHKYFVFTIIRDFNSKDYSRDTNRQIAAFKIKLPVEFDSWKVEIQVDVIVPLKIMVTNRVPDPILMAAKPDVFPIFDSKRGKYWVYVALPPATGQNFIHKDFYLAISPSFEATNVTSVKITLQRTVDVCFVQHSTFLEDHNNIERFICKGLIGDLNTIQCNCKQLGLFQAHRYPITINRLMLGDIPFTVPQSRFAYENLVITGILACLFVATFVVALLKDRSSQKQETLIYVEDNYPSDDYLIIIGVYTGLYFQGGTTSKVGIMLIGDKSSSRVHVLASQKRRTLATGQDDWFVITLSYSPGKITHINLWRDHRDISGWFCDRIIVYDVSENKLYEATVEKWVDLKISEEVPRVEVLEVVQIDPFDTSGSSRLTSHTFAKNYVREYRNTHDMLSIYTMHTRYLVTYEVKSHIIIAKLCFIYFWIWFIQEVVYGFIHGKFSSSILTGRLLDLSIEPFIWAFWAALLSHPFTYALDYYYRLTHLSRVLQKKTTNPFFLGTSSDKSRISSFSMRPSSRGKTSGLGRQRKSSFKTHRASSYKSRHTVGSKYAGTNVSGFHRRYIRLAVGPSQFRCVDVNCETIAMKTRMADRIVRSVSFVIVVAFLGFMVYVQVWTSFTWKWKTSAFVFVLAIIIDFILLGPLLIFIKSSIAFYVYHMTNREPFLLSDDVRVHQPLRTKYVNYLKLATRKEYKLPLSQDIEAARRKRLISVIAKRTVFSVLALLAMYCCYEVLTDKYGEHHFILMRSLKDSMTAARSNFGLRPKDPKDVKGFTSAARYVSNTIAALTGYWPNGQQPKSRSYRGTDNRWTYDHFGQGMGSSSVLLLYIDDEAEKSTVPLEFEEYFANATGYYSESTPEKDPLIIGDAALNYTILSDMVIFGKSLEVYPLAGHLKLIPLKPWEKYYSQMRILMDDAIIKQAYHDCRAVIISTNYVYPFIQYLATIDVLIEILPSGVSEVYIQTRGIKTGAPTNYRMMILRYIITAIFFCFSVYTIAVFSKVGLREYFRDSYNIFKFVIFLTNLATVFCYFLRFPVKYGAIEKLVNTAIEVYSDVHPIFAYEMADSLFLMFFFMAILIDFMKSVPKLIGTEWLNRLCVSSVRVTFIVVLLQLYFILMVEGVMEVITKTFGSYFILVHTHQPPANILDYHRKQGNSFYICVFILTIMSKFMTSLMINHALLIKGRTDIHLKKYVDMLKRKPLCTDPNNRQVTPSATMFHSDSQKKSEFKNDDQQSTALSMMSDKVASKHRLFF